MNRAESIENIVRTINWRQNMQGYYSLTVKSQTHVCRPLFMDLIRSHAIALLLLIFDFDYIISLPSLPISCFRWKNPFIFE